MMLWCDQKVLEKQTNQKLSVQPTQRGIITAVLKLIHLTKVADGAVKVPSAGSKLTAVETAADLPERWGGRPSVPKN